MAGNHYLDEDTLPRQGLPSEEHKHAASVFGTDYERHLNLEEATNNCTDTLKSFITPKFIAGFIVWLLMISGFAYLYFSGLLLDISAEIKDFGVVGTLIFIGMLIVIGLPFAWGFSATIFSISFIYGWVGAPVAYIGAIIGSTVCFFLVRYFARDFLQSRIDKMEPKLQLIVKEIERSATKTVCSSYPLLVGIRESPLPFGFVNALFALTTVTYARYLITAAISFLVSVPLNINLGIVARKLADLGLEDGATPVNATAEELALQEQSRQIEMISLSLSIVVTVIVIIASGAYGRWVMKKIEKLDESEIVKEIEEINEEANEEDEDLGFSRESMRLSFRPVNKSNQLDD